MTAILHQCRLDSPIGELTLIASEAGLRRISWPDEEVAHCDGVGGDVARAGDKISTIVNETSRLARVVVSPGPPLDRPLGGRARRARPLIEGGHV